MPSLTTRMSPFVMLWLAHDWIMQTVFCMVYKNTISQLQRAQNSLAHVVLRAPYRISPSPLLEQLHWLPIYLRIAFKISTLTFKTLNLGQPEYLGSVIKRHVPGRALRSVIDSERLNLPTTKTVISQRDFCMAELIIWNTLPYEIRSVPLLFTFRRQLKTLFYRQAFN